MDGESFEPRVCYLILYTLETRCQRVCPSSFTDDASDDSVSPVRNQVEAVSIGLEDLHHVFGDVDEKFDASN